MHLRGVRYAEAGEEAMSEERPLNWEDYVREASKTMGADHKTFTISCNTDPSRIARIIKEKIAEAAKDALVIPVKLPCDHSFQHSRGEDSIFCELPGCGLVITGQQLDAMRPHGYDTERTKLADRCGALESELKDVKAENCDLRRDVERLRRKK
jgi:hypothetical protein